MNQTDIVRDDSELHSEQIIAQMETILRSRHFCHAKSLERFLRHVVTKKLAGVEHELKEYTIGVEVFRRGEAFDQRTDAVVRVQAGALRKKLAVYYDEEGFADPVLIEIPKGCYVPCFIHRQFLANPASEVVDDAPVVNEARNYSAPRVAPHWAGVRRIAATFVIGVVVAVAFQQWWRDHTATRAETVLGSAKESNTEGVDPAYLPLWGKFLEPGVSNVLAYGTPQFFGTDGLYFREVQVNSANEIVPGTRLMKIQKNLHKPLAPAEIYTGVGETHGVYLLSRFFWKTGHDLRVSRNRLIGWDDLKDCNLVFLSSMRFHTLAKELPFPTDFVISEDTEAHVINLRPGPNEEPEYHTTTSQGSQYSYAVITLWPGKLANRRVLVLSGVNTWCTLAAAEYVTEPEHLRQLDQHLAECRDRSGAKEHQMYFQVLVRVEIKDDQPVAINYVTHHDLDIALPAPQDTPPISDTASVSGKLKPIH